MQPYIESCCDLMEGSCCDLMEGSYSDLMEEVYESEENII